MNNSTKHQSDGTTMIRVGKRSAGRMLDGREWSLWLGPSL